MKFLAKSILISTAFLVGEMASMNLQQEETLEISQLGSLQDCDTNANSVGPDGIQGHIDDQSEVLLDEQEFLDEYEDINENEDEDQNKTFLQLVDEKKVKGAGKGMNDAYCHQFCEKIKGGHGYVDKRCPKKCQKKLHVKAMPKHYDDPSKVRKRLMKRFHFGRKGPARHHGRRRRRRRR